MAEDAGVGLRAFLRHARVPDLQLLRLVGNMHYRQTETDNFPEALARFSVHAPRVHTLDISRGNGMSAERFLRPCRLSMPALDYLVANAVDLSVGSMGQFVTFFERCPRVATLKMDDCDALFDLGQLLPVFRGLRELHVQRSSLSLTGLLSLSSFDDLRAIDFRGARGIQASDSLFAAIFVSMVTLNCRCL